MNDIKNWVKEIQKNEAFAKKYKGLNNVKSIINQAREDGYDLKEEDLKEKNLKKISGGSISIKIVSQKANINLSATGQGASAQNNSSITMRVD